MSHGRWTSSFASLLTPWDRDDFFSNIWELQPLVIARSDPDFYHGLLSLVDLDRVLNTLHLRHPEIRLAKHEGPPESKDYTLADGRIDPLAVTKLFSDGSTIVFDQMQRRLPMLANLCAGLERELGIIFQTNIYLTPPNGGGFKVHYDTHDVFILQIAGSKTWELFDSPIALPLPGQVHDDPDVAPGELTTRFTMHPGDFAYIPRGIYHQAQADDALSLHITLGAMVTTWSEFFIEAMAELSLRDGDFRRAVPLGFGTSTFDHTSAQEQFRALARRLSAAMDFDAVARSFRDDFVRTRDGRLNGQLEQAAALPALSADSRVIAREARVFVIETRADKIVLRHLNTEIEFPVRAELGLRALLSGEPVCIGELKSGLDVDDNLVLARRLVREGFLLAVLQ